MARYLLFMLQAVTRWSYCRGCGEHTIQEKILEGWRCTDPRCLYINKR